MSYERIKFKPVIDESDSVLRTATFSIKDIIITVKQPQIMSKDICLKEKCYELANNQMIQAHFGEKPDWVDLKASVVICGPFCPVQWGCKGNRQFGHLYSTNTIPLKYRHTLTTFQRSFTKQLGGRMSTCSPAPFMFSSPWTPGPTHCIGWPALYQTLPFTCNTVFTQLLTLHAIIKTIIEHCEVKTGLVSLRIGMVWISIWCVLLLHAFD